MWFYTLTAQSDNPWLSHNLNFSKRVDAARPSIHIDMLVTCRLNAGVENTIQIPGYISNQ